MKRVFILVSSLFLKAIIFLTTFSAFAANNLSGGAKMVILETTLGSIELDLDDVNAPNTVANFVKYVETGHYDGTIFHRVIPDFMIQGGGMKTGMIESPTLDAIKNEAANGLKNLRGTIAMARTQDPHSATAQFFINLKDNNFLDHTEKSSAGWGYAVFGEVSAGMEVIDQIAAVKTGSVGHHQDVPLDEVIINKALLSMPKSQLDN